MDEHLGRTTRSTFARFCDGISYTLPRKKFYRFVSIAKVPRQKHYLVVQNVRLFVVTFLFTASTSFPNPLCTSGTYMPLPVQAYDTTAFAAISAFPLPVYILLFYV